METRDFLIREVDHEKREIAGIAVPYDEVVEVGGFREKFVRGAFGDVKGAKLFYGHDHLNGGLPIGLITEGRDTDQGFEIRAHISETAKGDEVYRLLRDGVLDKFSIGFEPVQDRQEDGVVVRTKAALKEVSVVAFPAYATAGITEVRSEINDNKKETPMTDVVDNSQDVADLRDSVTDLERRIAVLSDSRDEAPRTPQFRSGGELLKALAAGDETARAQFRAADSTGPATSTQAGAAFDVGAGNWLSNPLKFVDEKRRTVNLFSRAALPPAGNTIEYPKVGSTSGTVAAQAAEGDALSYMEVELSTGTATVGTYGGYSRLSRQAIERSDMAYLDAVLRYQALQYAKATEAVVRAAVVGASSTGTGTVSADTAAAWIGAVIDAAGDIEDDSLGLSADFMLVGRDVFKRLMVIEDSTDRPIFAINGDGQNSIGNGNIVRASASIGGLPVVVNPALSANTAIVASRDAVVTLESPGAPFRLQDESVVNLTKDFSLYGYLAVAVLDPKGLVVLDVDLV